MNRRRNPLPKPVALRPVRGLGTKYGVMHVVTALMRTRSGRRRLLWALCAVCSDAQTEMDRRGLLDSDQPESMLATARRYALGEATLREFRKESVSFYDRWYAPLLRAIIGIEKQPPPKPWPNDATMSFAYAVRAGTVWVHFQNKPLTSAQYFAETVEVTIESLSKLWAKHLGYGAAEAHARVLGLLRATLMAP